jgi:WD40 repeat protein
VSYATYADGRVETTDPVSGERVDPSFRVGGAVHDLATSPDGARVAVVAMTEGGGVLTLHDAATGERLAGPVEGVDRVAVSDRAVAGARGGAVTVYDPDTLQAVHDLPGARGEVNLLAFDADGSTLLATSNDQTVSVYDTSSWIRLGDPIPADAPLIYPAYLHPDGDSLLVTVAKGVAWWHLDAETLRAAACQVAGRDLTRTEWTAYMAGLGPYRSTCPP